MKRWLVLGLSLFLNACATPEVDHYRQEKPVLDVSRYFEGSTEAWGMFQKRGGEVVKRFHVNLEGRWQGEAFIIEEHFVYSDGSKQHRVWTLRRQPDGRWLGTAPDVVGKAIGEAAGNALRWNYVLRLPVDGKEYEVHMDDWMYLIDEQTLVNRTRMSKFGVEIGQVTLFFRKKM